MTKFDNTAFNRVPIIGILRHVQARHLDPVLSAFVKSGLTTIEITMNTEGATDLIRRAVASHGTVINIGAGTVCTVTDLHEALEAGAQFIVTPIMEEAVIVECVDLGIPIFSGALTPTEIYKAWNLGATMVKVFPANTIGSRYLSDISAPIDKVGLLATGGISLHNMAEYWRVGVRAFGIGDSLFNQNFINRGDWAGLVQHFELFANGINKLMCTSV